jgi:hypothetical protein
MWWHCYLRRGIVYLPTVGVIDKGFYREIEPVAVVPLSNIEALRMALSDTMARGNPKVPSLGQSQKPPPVILKYAGVKTWTAFAHATSTWGFGEQDGAFQIVGYRDSATGGWEQDPDNIVTLPSGSTPEEAVDRIILILQAAAR